eukprot:m.282974 g.282974  ORF g.282974 m.282974 type:complete len:1665 (+) comp17755_c0_seq4:1769-6763(+)
MPIDPFRSEESAGWGTRLHERDLWANILRRIHDGALVKLKEDLTTAETAKSLNIFGPKNSIRMFCQRIVTSKKFDMFILLTIILNCGTLAASDPNADPDNPSAADSALEVAEYVFLAIFIFEMLFKMIGLGLYFCGPPSYLKDNWNRLDFFIVVTAIIGLVVEQSGAEGANFRALRAFRVLRPLRLISSLKSLQLVMMSILASIPTLNNVAKLLLFLIIIYAIIGLDFYRGQLGAQCFLEAPANATGDFVFNNTQYFLMDDGRPCDTGTSGRQCTSPSVCLDSEAPNNGVTMFDHAGVAILTVFQCITLEGWTDVLYNMNDANGAKAVNWLFFFTLVVFGAFFVMNLVLGVLSGQFTRVGEQNRKTLQVFRQRRKVEQKRYLTNYTEWVGTGSSISEINSAQFSLPEHIQPYNREALQDWHPHTMDQEDARMFRFRYSGDGDDDDDVQGGDTLVVNLSLPSFERIFVQVEANQTIGDIRQQLLVLFDNEDRGLAKEDRQKLATYKFCHPEDGHMLNSDEVIGRIGVKLITLSEYLEVVSRMGSHNQHELLKPSTLQILSPVGAITKQRWFSRTVTALVLLNTILQASVTDSDTDHKATKQFFEIAELIFVVIFVMEMLVKMYGLGIKGYFSSKFNTFDCLVVTGSVLEMIFVMSIGARSIGISTLRSLRLLRVFREIPTYWESVNDFVAALIQSIASILSLLLLLFIFMVILALLGMQAFGGRFEIDGSLQRINFDDFGSAMIAIFIVLTGEDWNSVMYQGIESWGGINDNGWISVVFFCLVVIVGSFVLLNVFLAIAVKSLDDAAEMKNRRLEHREKWLHSQFEDGMSEDDREELRQGRHYANPLVPEEPEHHVANDGKELRPYLMQDITQNTVLCSLTPTNKFRLWCHNIAFDSRFDAFILLLILISSALLAVEDPVHPEAQINKDLETADIVFTTIFGFEMFVKIVSLGLWGYVKDPWNDLDAVVVLASVMSLAIQSDDVAAIRILRVFRVLRPLRAIKRAPGLRHVVQCVIISVKTIGNVFIVSFLFTFIFAVIGVQRFKGCYGECNDPSIGPRTDCVGNFTTMDLGVPTSVVREWETPFFNFNDVGTGMMTLFAVSTLEGWIDVMNSAMDCTGENLAPERNHNPAAALFFVVYIVVVAFFLLNIFVGYVIITFGDEGEKYYAESGLDSNQRKCLHYALTANPEYAFQPDYRNQRYLSKVALSAPFEYVIMATIIANSLIMLVQYYGMSEAYEDNLALANIVFTVIFTFEALVKLWAFNPTAYFMDTWNCFDFLIVVGSWVDIGLSLAGGDGVSIGFLRLFRVARLIKLISKGNDMKRLLWTFGKSLKALPSVALLIAMVFFVYAVVGMQLFGQLAVRADSAINDQNNFRTFPNALLLLFRSSTGENWQQIMAYMVQGPSDCNVVDSEESCGSGFAVFYMITFVIIVSFLVLQLFVAIIIDNFEYLTRDASMLGEQDLPAFGEVWARYDPDNKRRLHHSDVLELLKHLKPPLGFESSMLKKVAYAKMMRMQAPLHDDGTIDFNAALLALVRVQLHVFVASSEGDLEERNDKLRSKIKRFFAFPDEMLDRALPSAAAHRATTGQLYAVYLLQELYRKSRGLRADRMERAQSNTMVIKAGGADALPEPREMRRQLSTEDVPGFDEGEDAVPMQPVHLHTAAL